MLLFVSAMMIVSCSKDEEQETNNDDNQDDQKDEKELPVVVLDSVGNVTDSTATLYGNVTSDGNDTLIERGFTVALTTTPTIDGDMVYKLGKDTGIFTVNLAELFDDTTYYCRAFATNSIGTSYSAEKIFNTPETVIEVDTVINDTTITDTTINDTLIRDFDGNIYTEVTVATQVWLKENIAAEHYMDGTPIPGVRVYGDVETNAGRFGRLYTWDDIMNGASSTEDNPSGIQGPCPDGYHVPSDPEWKQLELFLGMKQSQADSLGWRGTVEAMYILEGGNTGLEIKWTGLYDADVANYAGKLTLGFYWTATDYNASYAYFRQFEKNIITINRQLKPKDYGFSLRCIKD